MQITTDKRALEYIFNSLKNEHFFYTLRQDGTTTVNLWKHENLLFWQHYGRSANKATKKDLEWIITNLFKETPLSFLAKYKEGSDEYNLEYNIMPIGTVFRFPNGKLWDGKDRGSIEYVYLGNNGRSTHCYISVENFQKREDLAKEGTLLQAIIKETYHSFRPPITVNPTQSFEFSKEEDIISPLIIKKFAE